MSLHPIVLVLCMTFCIMHDHLHKIICPQRPLPTKWYMIKYEISFHYLNFFSNIFPVISGKTLAVWCKVA